MSLRLNGLNPLSYLGVTPTSPPQFVKHAFSPTPNDWQNVNLGTIWLNTATEDVYFLVSLAGNVAVWVLLTGGAGAVTSLTTQDSNVVTPTAGTINVIGSGSVATTGTIGPNTATIALTGITEFDVQTGGTSSTLHNVAPSATSGVPLVSQGSSAQPIFGTAVVPGGGTGDTSFTAYAPIAGGTTTTGALQSAATGMATVGSVLTSTGSASLPTWQNMVNPGPLFLSVTITSQQIKNLNGTPITLIAAPGSGEVITIVDYVFKYNYGGTSPFVAAAAQSVQLYWGGLTGTAVVGVINNAGLVGTTTLFAFGPGIGITGDYANFNDQDVVLANPVATEISGNAANDNTLIIEFYYNILAI